MISFLSIGVILGLSAGFAPGPLLALVISETLRHGAAAGVRVALSPILTDLPIILASLLVLGKLSHVEPLLGVVSLGGGLFLLLLGYQNFQPAQIEPSSGTASAKSLAKGVLTNILSPHPYLFWFSVGAPTMVDAMDSGMLPGVAFLGGFYVCLVGAKILLAVLAGRSRTFLSGPVYRLIMKILGLLLIVLAGLLFRDGLQLLGILP